jgi:4'-phosphopantetheinyl transferase
VAQLESILAPDELDRAARFRSHSLERSFIVVRGLLRVLLGRYLGTPAESLQFNYGPNGRPSIAGSSTIDFNISHAGDIAMFAFSGAGQVGIDVEAIREIPEMADVARRFFCPSEVEEWEALPEGQRDLAFYRCWTRRESYIKAAGVSLATDLDQLRVSLRPDTPPRFMKVPDAADRSSAWSLHEVSCMPGYVVALAYRGVERHLRIFPVVDVEQLLGIL